MTVIDMDSRFTFKVDRKGKVGHTITKRTKTTKRAVYINGKNAEGADYQETHD